MSQARCNRPVPILGLAGVVVANTSLGKQLEVSKPAHPHTFFGAKTAATFIGLRDELLNGPHPHSISFSVRRRSSDYRHSIYFLVDPRNFTCPTASALKSAIACSRFPKSNDGIS